LMKKLQRSDVGFLASSTEDQRGACDSRSRTVILCRQIAAPDGRL
jgi:hypothetical protein